MDEGRGCVEWMWMKREEQVRRILFLELNTHMYTLPVDRHVQTEPYKVGGERVWMTKTTPHDVHTLVDANRTRVQEEASTTTSLTTLGDTYFGFS